MRALALEFGHSPWWRLVGYMGVLAGMLILSFYSVVAGWTLAYRLKMASGAFVGQSAAHVSGVFGRFVGSPEQLLTWHTLFILMTTAVVARGARGVILFAVNRPEGNCLAPAWETDPGYAQRLVEVCAAGVEVIAVRIRHGADALGVGEQLSVDLYA